MTSGSPFGTTCGLISTPRKAATPWTSSATSTGESEEQAAAMLLNCSVADLEKLPAPLPDCFPSYQARRTETTGDPSGQCYDAAGVRLPVPDQRHRPGGGVRLRPCSSALRKRRPSQCRVCGPGWTRKGATPPCQGDPHRLPLPADFTGQREGVQLSTGKGPAENYTPLKHPSICCPTFLCTRRDGRTTPMWPCAGSAQPRSTVCWKPSPSCRKSSCAWITMKPVTKPPDALPRNCCGSGMSPYPLSFPSRRTGTMNCSPFAQKKAKG